MTKVLISYRRADTANVAGRIFDKLVVRYGTDNVFMDISNTPLGVDFRDHIADVFANGDILIALIGREWAGSVGDGSRRIDRANDMVRIEIETALQRKIPLIPVLIDDAPMPQPTDLPPSLEALAYRHAAELDSFRDFHPHMDRLIEAIDRLVARPQPARAPVRQPEPPTSSWPSVVEESRAANTTKKNHEERPPGSQPTTGSMPSLAQDAPPREAESPPVFPKGRRDTVPIPDSRPAFAAARVLRWALLLLLVLLATRSLIGLVAAFATSAALDAGLKGMLLFGYYLHQVPLLWIFAALFLGWEFYALRALQPSRGASDGRFDFLRLLAWPYSALVTIRDAANGGALPRWPVAVTIIGIFISVVVSWVWGMLLSDAPSGEAVRARVGVIRVVEAVWTITLFVMIWKIGRSPKSRKN